MIASFDEFVGLVERDDQESHFRLKTEAAPISVWEEVIFKRPDLRRVVTLNKTLEHDVLRLLARDEDSAVRSDVATRRALPIDLFEILARDEDESVRARIAWNKKTPEQVLKYLLNDESPIVLEPVKKRLGLL
jgi:hypothetical protein